MSGITIPLITKRTFDFSSLATNTIQTIVLIKEFDVISWTEGSLNVRVHGGIMDASVTAKLSLALHSTSPTPEDPTKDFIDLTASGIVTVAPADVSGSPMLLRGALSSNFGGKLALVIVGTQDTTAALANFHVDISVEVVLKN
jgi:hypothetical protein